MQKSVPFPLSPTGEIMDKIEINFTKDIKKKNIRNNFEFMLNYYLGRIELTNKNDLYEVEYRAQCSADNMIYIALKIGLIEHDEYKRLYRIIFHQTKM